MITKIGTIIKCKHKIRSSKLNDIKIKIWSMTYHSVITFDLLFLNLNQSLLKPRKKSWAMEALFLRSNISNRRTATTKKSSWVTKENSHLCKVASEDCCYAFRAIQIPTNTIRLSKTTRKLYEASFRTTNSTTYFFISQFFRWIF